LITDWKIRTERVVHPAIACQPPIGEFIDQLVVNKLPDPR